MFQCIQLVLHFSTRPWCSERPDSRTLARLALEFSVQREQQCIFLNCHTLYYHLLHCQCIAFPGLSFSLSLYLSSTLVQDYIKLVEYSSLCTTLKCTVGPSVSLSLSGERQNRGARPSGGPVSLPFTFNWGQNTVNSVKPSLQKQSL